MYETDDRLDGDLVWEIFAPPAPAPGLTDTPGSRIGRWAVVLSLIVVGGLFFPPMAVLVACLAIAWPDFRAGRRIARTLPDRSSARVCARFHYAWGTWKIGGVAIALMFLVAFAFAPIAEEAPPPAGFVAAGILGLVSFTVSAVLAASGVWAAYRSGMRVWIGEGANRARTLLLSMLIIGLIYGYILPMCFWLVSLALDHRGDQNVSAVLFVLCVGSVLIGPLVVLLVLDAIARRVIAETPSKFGKAVSAVGKWSTKPPQPTARAEEWPTA